MSKQIGVLYHPHLPEAHALCEELVAALCRQGYDVWSSSAWAERWDRKAVAALQAVVAIGGDGTILRAARVVLPTPVPILGVRYGHLGFIAEVLPEEALARVPILLEKGGYIQRRAMLQASCAHHPVDPVLTTVHHPLLEGDPHFHGLNDVVLARGRTGRPITVGVEIDGQGLTTYRADAVMVATATGSTGYALSAGGPVLHPVSQCLVLTPVVPHATLGNALVLEPNTTVRLTLESDLGGTLSIDGQVDLPVSNGETITVQRSPYSAHIIRAVQADSFYSNLLPRLRLADGPAQ